MPSRTRRWVGFVITSTADLTVFTPVGVTAIEQWEDHWENHPGVGNYGVVTDLALASRISADLAPHFDLKFAQTK